MRLSFAGAVQRAFSAAIYPIPRFGLSGAALATSIALVLETVALYFATRNRLGIRSFVLFSLSPFKTATGTVT